VEQIAIAHWQAKQKLAASHVIDDLERLEDRARAELAVAFARGQEQQVHDARLLDRLRNCELKVTPEKADRLAFDVLHVRSVTGQFELVILEETARSARARQIQAVPIDYRAPAQNQPQRLDVMEGKLADAL
jgi:hypothetical protein